MKHGAHEAAIWVDPGRCGGSPCITGTRITTAAAAGMVLSLGVAEALNCWPHLDEDDLKAACWFEARHGRRSKLRKAFKEWAETHDEALWRNQWGEVPLPDSA